VHEQKILTVTIHDNGTGFDPAEDSSDRKPHYGLDSMRDRADAIGASFEVHSEKGLGTQVIVRLPLAGKGES
jgi:two-component system nitrate/nitrite sensor histidine kinase NarX